MPSSDLHTLSPLRKAAILIATLDRVTSDRLLDQMTDEQSRAVRDEVLNLEDVPQDLQQAVLREFFGDSEEDANPSLAARNELGTSDHDGGVELDLSSGEKTPETYDETWSGGVNAPTPARGGDRPLGFLEKLAPEILQAHLEPEHPQTIAVVLANLHPRYAAKLLAGFSPVVQADLARRIIDLEETDATVLEDLARSFTAIVETHVRKQNRRKTGINRLAEILAVAQEPDERRILADLDALRRDLTPRIETARRAATPRSPRTLPFTQIAAVEVHTENFRDLTDLSDEDLLTVFRHVDAEDVVRALADDPTDLTDRIAKRLPREQARMLERALRDVGPLRPADVAAARETLLDAARRLGFFETSLRLQAA